VVKQPFPYFGGKSRVAGEVWRRFGDVKNYIESFCGSAGVLLNRPAPVHRASSRERLSSCRDCPASSLSCTTCVICCLQAAESIAVVAAFRLPAMGHWPRRRSLTQFQR
jgi:hypothetical protein